MFTSQSESALPRLRATKSPKATQASSPSNPLFSYQSQELNKYDFPARDRKQKSKDLPRTVQDQKRFVRARAGWARLRHGPVPN
jgi:hypothetical protein